MPPSQIAYYNFGEVETFSELDPVAITPAILRTNTPSRTRSGREINSCRPLSVSEIERRFNLYQRATEEISLSTTLWESRRDLGPHTRRFLRQFKADCRRNIYIRWGAQHLHELRYEYYQLYPHNETPDHQNWFVFGSFLRREWPNSRSLFNNT